jgi:hypothetical protein
VVLYCPVVLSLQNLTAVYYGMSLARITPCVHLFLYRFHRHRTAFGICPALD